MSEEWGPWIEHDGSGCPVVGRFVCVETRRGDFVETIAGADCIKDGLDPSGPCSAWFWHRKDFLYRDPITGVMDYVNTLGEVIRYRVRKPRGLTILERIAQQPERADA